MTNSVSKTALNKITAAFIGAENKTAELIEAIKAAGGVAEKAVIRHLYLLNYCAIQWNGFTKLTGAMEQGAFAWYETKAKERLPEDKAIYDRVAKRVSRFLKDNGLVSENQQGQGRKKGQGKGATTKAKTGDKAKPIAKLKTSHEFNNAVLEAAMALLTFSEKNDEFESPLHEVILDFVGRVKDELAELND
jgi:hypothetical protein